ncbi:MAG: trehalose-phosphatase, partial [Pseudomonadota bacterium]
FLDVDGTLLPIEDRPDDVVASAAVTALLQRLAERLSGALALVSGRPLSEIDRLFAPLKLPAAGAHGSEFRRDERGAEAQSPPSLTAAIVTQLQQFAAQHEGLLLEDKPHGVALHYRARPELETESRGAVNRAAAAAGSEFSIIAGKMVFELTPAAFDKGRAIERFLDGAPFAGRRPVFIGDDVTDESGFECVNRLGGVSVRVGENTASAAAHALDDVTAVHAWLYELAGQ